MKKLSAILTVLALLQAEVTEGAVDNWVFVTRYKSPTGHQDDDDQYISKDRIKRLQNGNVVVRVLGTNYASGTHEASDYYLLNGALKHQVFEHRSNVMVMEFDCMSEMERNVSHLIYYSGPMATGQAWTPTHTNAFDESPEIKNVLQGWNPVPKGTFYESIMDAVCN